MDNLKAHKTEEVKDLMRELDINWIWVVPYSPQFNPIELPFSQVKKYFKEIKLQNLVKNVSFDQHKAIRESFKVQKISYIDKCIKHSQRLLL